MPLVLEAHGDAVVAEGPQVLAQHVVELALPLARQERDDLVAAARGTRRGCATASPRCTPARPAPGRGCSTPSSAACTFWRADASSNGGSGGRASDISRQIARRRPGRAGSRTPRGRRGSRRGARAGRAPRRPRRRRRRSARRSGRARRSTSSQPTSGPAGPSTRDSTWSRSGRSVMCLLPPCGRAEPCGGELAHAAYAAHRGASCRARRAWSPAVGEHVDRHAVRWRARRARGAGAGSAPSSIASCTAASSSVCSARSGERRSCSQERPRLGLERHLAALPRAPAQLHGRLEQRELVDPGGEPAGAAEIVEPRSTLISASSAASSAMSSSSSPRTCGERRPAPADLEARGAQQQVAQAGDRIVALGPRRRAGSGATRVTRRRATPCSRPGRVRPVPSVRRQP